jgi:hypothetical protein
VLALPRELDAGPRPQLHRRRGGRRVVRGLSGVEEAPGLTAVLEVLRDVSQIPPGVRERVERGLQMSRRAGRARIGAVRRDQAPRKEAPSAVGASHVVKDVEPSRTRPPTCLPPGARATVELLRACSHAQAHHRPRRKVQPRLPQPSRRHCLVGGHLRPRAVRRPPSGSWPCSRRASRLLRRGGSRRAFCADRGLRRRASPCHDHGAIEASSSPLSRRRSR